MRAVAAKAVARWCGMEEEDEVGAFLNRDEGVGSERERREGRAYCGVIIVVEVAVESPKEEGAVVTTLASS